MCILFLKIGLISAMASTAVLPAASPGVAEALQGLDAHYASFLNPWLISLWDSSSGGQRRSASAGVDLQSSGQFVSTLEATDLLADMPAEVKTLVVGYFQSRQDPSDGFFYDFTGQSLSTRDKGRYLTYATGALSRLGAAPLYPLPDSDSGGVPPELANAATFRYWLAALPWDNPWTAGDQINAQLPIIQVLSQKEELLAELWAFLPTKQHAGTGYWGNSASATDYTYLSGAAKISSAYTFFGVPVPRADTLYTSGKNTLLTQTASQATHVRNVLWLFDNIAMSMSHGIPPADQIAIIDKSAANIAKFLNSDGGFGMSASGVSDMDAASQATKTRTWSYERIAGQVVADWPGRDNFWQHSKFDLSFSRGGSFEAEVTPGELSGAASEVKNSNGASGGER
ncbi:MAG: hypothetical protein WD708_06835 [Kiritimatiellia bacterium]